MAATPPSELVGGPELRRGLLAAIEQIAPKGSTRSVPCNTFCDTLLELLADMLTATGGTDDAEIERLTEMFHDRLVETLAQRDGAVGHA